MLDRVKNDSPYVAVKRLALNRELYIRKDLPVGRIHTHTHTQTLRIRDSGLLHS